MLRTFTASITGVLILVSTAAFAQAIGEYSRSIGTVAPKKGAAVSTSGKSIASPSRNKSVAQGVSGEEPAAFPGSLTVRAPGASLYARSDDLADKITSLAAGAKLTPLLEASGVAAQWYMVKTETGLVGWIKSAEVESAPSAKP